MDAVSFVLGAKVESVFATLETFHKKRVPPEGRVKTFAKVNPKDMCSTSWTPRTLRACYCNTIVRRTGSPIRVHANASISQVAAGWKCSLAIGVYGTEAACVSICRTRTSCSLAGAMRPTKCGQRCAPGFHEDVAHFTDYPGGHAEGFPDSHKMHYRCVYEHIASEGRRRNSLPPRKMATRK
jgi:hypothetical protein